MSDSLVELEKRGEYGVPCNVYSRIVGYYADHSAWNIGKKQEFSDRITFDVQKVIAGIISVTSNITKITSGEC